MNAQSALNLVDVWKKEWPERETMQTHGQMVMLALANEVGAVIALRTRAEAAEREVEALNDKISRAREVLE